MVMNREDIYRLFGDKDLTYVFKRVIIDTSKQRARDTIKVRGSLLEEDLQLTNMEGLMLEMLLGDQFVGFYQHLINLSYDRRSQEDKLYTFSVSLYRWVSERLGYIPDWVLPDREKHLKTIINLLLLDADDFIPDSEVLLGLLLRNTDFSKSHLFKEQLRKGIWSSTVTGISTLDIAEDEYLLGKTNTEVDSLSLYVRLAERGYRDVDTLNTYISHRTFKDTVVTDYDTVCRALNAFMWQYGGGDNWEGFTGEVFSYLTQVRLKRVAITKPNPNEIIFRDKDTVEDVAVQFTFSDKIVVTVRKGTMVVVAYNQDFYTATFKGIVDSLGMYEFRAKNVIPVIKVLCGRLPVQIPNKKRELECYIQK